MKIFKITVLSLLVLLAAPAIGVAQDFTFSQFYEMPLLRNPAIAGLFSGDVRVQMAYRRQWESVTTPYKTMALSSEVKFPVGAGNDYLTTSIQITNDVAGDAYFSRLQLLPAFNFLKSLNDGNSYLSAGVIAGLVQNQFDPTKMTFDDQFQNGRFSPTNITSQTFKKTNESYFDASAGIAYSNIINGSDSKFYIGAALYHFTKPKLSFFDDAVIMQPRLVINAGLNLVTSEFDNVYVYGDYIKQGGNRQMLMGLLYGHAFSSYSDEDHKYGIYIGGFYRWGDAFIPVAKLELDKLSLGFSYDINTSKLKSASQLRGGFEVTGSFKSFLNIRKSSRGRVECPVTF